MLQWLNAIVTGVELTNRPLIPSHPPGTQK